LEQTIHLVCESLNMPIEMIRKMAPLKNVSYPPLSQLRNGKSEEPIVVESEDLSTLSYEDLRERAMHHFQKRKAYFEQAQQAFRKKTHSVATYYAQMGRVHDAKLKEANHQAANKILNYRKNHDPQDTIDLHGLHVKEAISALADRLKEFENRPGKQLNIVTGFVKHSSSGPRIKPAVLAFLARRMYKVFEVNNGLVQVTID